MGGQCLGVAGILAAAVVGALGAGLLPAVMLPYLGLRPLVLGVRAGWRVWAQRRSGSGSGEDDSRRGKVAPGVLTVGTVTFANGGDNIGVNAD